MSFLGDANTFDEDTKRLQQTRSLLRKTLKTLNNKNARWGHEGADDLGPQAPTTTFEYCGKSWTMGDTVFTKEQGRGKVVCGDSEYPNRIGVCFGNHHGHDAYRVQCTPWTYPPSYCGPNSLYFVECADVTTNPDSDSYCLEGIPAPGICCHSSCGTCGGYHCNQRPGGAENCCMQNINANGRICNSPTDVACIIPEPEQCWTESTDGRAFADVISATSDDQYYVYTNLKYSECLEKANAIDAEGGTYYFAYSETLKNGFCQILNPKNTHPAISQSTSYDFHLYVNTCQPSIVLVNKDSFEISGAFDWGSGWNADSINDPFGQDEERLYTGLDPFMMWAQIREGSVIPKVGVWYGMGVQYVLCEENVSFYGSQKKYYFSVNDGVPQCTTQE